MTEPAPLELNADHVGSSTVVRVAGEIDLVFAECSFTVLRAFEVSGLTECFLPGENAVS